MYNYNAKSGLFVEEVRLNEIRQAIQAQRLRDEVRNNGSEPATAKRGRWFDRVRTFFAAHTARAEHQKVWRGVG